MIWLKLQAQCNIYICSAAQHNINYSTKITTTKRPRHKKNHIQCTVLLYNIACRSCSIPFVSWCVAQSTLQQRRAVLRNAWAFCAFLGDFDLEHVYMRSNGTWIAHMFVKNILLSQAFYWSKVYQILVNYLWKVRRFNKNGFSKYIFIT